jgi:hypothetical protein
MCPAKLFTPLYRFSQMTSFFRVRHHFRAKGIYALMVFVRSIAH